MRTFRSQSTLPAAVSQVHSRGGGGDDLVVSNPLLWAVHGASSLHSRDGCCFRVPPLVGCLDASVSGRLADSGVFSGGSLFGKGPCSQLMPGAGNCGKFGQINLPSIPTDCVSGNQDRFAVFQGFGDSLEDRKVLLNSRRISVLKGAVCEVLGGSARPPRISDAPRAEWPASHENLTTESKARLGFSGRGDPGSLGCPFSRRSSVVVRQGSSRGGGFFGPALSRPNVLVRRLRPRLGGYGRRSLCIGGLAGGRRPPLHQPAQAVGGGEGSQGPLFLSAGSCGHSVLRQHDCGGIS